MKKKLFMAILAMVTNSQNVFSHKTKLEITKKNVSLKIEESSLEEGEEKEFNIQQEIDSFIEKKINEKRKSRAEPNGTYQELHNVSSHYRKLINEFDDKKSKEKSFNCNDFIMDFVFDSLISKKKIDISFFSENIKNIKENLENNVKENISILENKVLENIDGITIKDIDSYLNNNSDLLYNNSDNLIKKILYIFNNKMIDSFRLPEIAFSTFYEIISFYEKKYHKSLCELPISSLIDFTLYIVYKISQIEPLANTLSLSHYLYICVEDEKNITKELHENFSFFRKYSFIDGQEKAENHEKNKWLIIENKIKQKDEHKTQFLKKISFKSDGTRYMSLANIEIDNNIFIKNFVNDINEKNQLSLFVDDFLNKICELFHENFMNDHTIYNIIKIKDNTSDISCNYFKYIASRVFYDFIQKKKKKTMN